MVWGRAGASLPHPIWYGLSGALGLWAHRVGSRARPDPTRQTNNNNTPRIHNVRGVVVLCRLADRIGLSTNIKCSISNKMLITYLLLIASCVARAGAALILAAFIAFMAFMAFAMIKDVGKEAATGNRICKCITHAYVMSRVSACVRVCVHAIRKVKHAMCMCVCMHVCVHVHVCACACVCMCIHVSYACMYL